jgi:hypothetical protein
MATGEAWDDSTIQMRDLSNGLIFGAARSLVVYDDRAVPVLEGLDQLPTGRIMLRSSNWGFERIVQQPQDPDDANDGVHIEVDPDGDLSLLMSARFRRAPSESRLLMRADLASAVPVQLSSVSQDVGVRVVRRYNLFESGSFVEAATLTPVGHPLTPHAEFAYPDPGLAGRSLFLGRLSRLQTDGIG